MEKLLIVSLVLHSCVADYYKTKPDFIKTCLKSDPNFDDCSKESVQRLFNALGPGLPEINLPPIDPLNIPKIRILQGEGPVNVNAALENVVVTGFGKTDVISSQSIQEVENVINIIQIQHVRRSLRNRRTFKTRKNPFHLYSDEEFRLKYCFSKHGVNFLNRLFGSAIALDKRGGGLSPMLQILIALRYWGRNQIQDDAADTHGLSQQSISRICKRVAKVILEKRFDYIKMPNSINEQIKTIQEFETLAGFKIVIGAIDCTHIIIPKVQGPSGQFSQVDSKTYAFFTRVRVPKMRIEGTYDLKGRILLIPLVGNGLCWFEPSNMSIDIISDVKLYEKDGFSFFNVTKVHVKYNIGGMKLHMSNLFDGISSLEDGTNAYLNSNWRPVSESLRPILSKTIEDILLDFMQQIFHNLPANFMIEDLKTHFTNKKSRKGID